MSNGPSPSPAGFSVGRTVGEAYAFVFRHWRALVGLGALPMLAVFAVNLAALYLRFTTGSFLWMLSGLLIVWVILSSFAVSWHRYVLLGEKPGGAPFHFSFGPREGRYFVYAMLVLLPLIAVSLLALLLMQDPTASTNRPLALLGLIVMSVGLVVAIRLSLAFPSVAVDGGHDAKQAWALSKGSGWRLFMLLILTLMPSELAGQLVVLVMAGAGSIGLAPRFLGALVEFVGGTVLITGLSLAFRELVGLTPPRQPPAKPISP